MAQVLPDPRDPALIEHSQHSLLRQRIHGVHRRGPGAQSTNNSQPRRVSAKPATGQARMATRSTRQFEHFSAWPLTGHDSSFPQFGQITGFGIVGGMIFLFPQTVPIFRSTV